MFKGYFVADISIGVWRDHFAHSVIIRAHRQSSARVVIVLVHVWIRQADRRDARGKVRLNTTIQARLSFLMFCMKAMSYVPAADGQCSSEMSTYENEREGERERTGDDSDASVQRRRQQIVLAIMCLSGCLAWIKGEQAKEWERSIGQVVSRSLCPNKITSARSMFTESTEKNKNAATNFFPLSFIIVCFSLVNV